MASNLPPQPPSRGWGGGLPNTPSTGSDDIVATCARLLCRRGEISWEQFQLYMRDEARDDIDGLIELVDDARLESFRRTSYRIEDPRPLILQYASHRPQITPASTTAFNQATALNDRAAVPLPPSYSDPTTTAALPSSSRSLASTIHSSPNAPITPRARISSVLSRPPASATPTLASRHAAPRARTQLAFRGLPESAATSSSNGHTRLMGRSSTDLRHPAASATPTPSDEYMTPRGSIPTEPSHQPTSATPNLSDGNAAPDNTKKRKSEAQQMLSGKRPKISEPPRNFQDAESDDELSDVVMNDVTEQLTSEKTAPVKGSKATATRKPRQPKRDTHVNELPYPKNRGRIDENAEYLSDLRDIFDHLTARASSVGLDTALEILEENVIKVATMCSGTESPLLALQMIKDSLKRMSGKNLNYNHLFSAEIVPFKQAYIERNFSPKLLFRDIRELADPKGSKASTAYGADARIPRNVDLLVAGFACVDFSKLNSSGKAFGESKDTFVSILEYARKYSPAILILENVSGAPWEKFKAIWQGDKDWMLNVGRKTTSKVLHMDAEERKFYLNFWKTKAQSYMCEWVIVDTRDYYLPQTRQRGYMICLSRKAFGNSPAAQQLVYEWRKTMGLLQRRASVSVEAILMTDDDRRVSQAKAEFSKTAKDVRIETDWEICAAGYQEYREKQLYGTGRPITKWINGGTAKAPDYWWFEWFHIQVSRIWDTFDVAYIRNVTKGFDSFYKVRVWELSQNVYRSYDSVPFGTIGCITPTGMPFLTTRGGPITGREALALQGLPIDKLLLTRESQRELQEMAGNAMSTTVVGAAILSALIVGAMGLTKRIRNNPRVESPKDSLSFVNMDSSKLGPKRNLDIVGCTSTSVAELCSLADAGSRRCHHEGQTLTTRSRFLECQACHHRSCRVCSGLPQHVYRSSRCNKTKLPRDPFNFIKALKKALPMSLQIVGVSLEELKSKATYYVGEEYGKEYEEEWTEYWDTVEPVVGEHYRYQKSKRAENWTITYEGQTGRLELVCGEAGVQWFLYAKTKSNSPLKSRSRELFKQPIAKMFVSGDNVLEGSWSFRLPNPAISYLLIEGMGRLSYYWESLLGIHNPDIADKRIWSILEVSVDDESVSAEVPDVSGTYQSLRKCGTASGFLYKKVTPIENAHGRPLYLFLDPDRVGDPSLDCCVFSYEKHRLDYGDNRDVILRVEASWRPSTVTGEAIWTPECFLDGQWRDCKATLRASAGLDSAFHQVLRQGTSISAFAESELDVIDCMTSYTTLVYCELPKVALGEDVMDIDQPWETITPTEERKMVLDTSWFMKSLRALDEYSDWSTRIKSPIHLEICQQCTPKMPLMKWMLSHKKVKTIKPYEDGKTAGAFERALKARPTPFSVQVKRSNGVVYCLRIGINLPTIVHRACAKLGQIAETNEIRISWSLNTIFRLETPFRPAPYTITQTVKAHQHGANHKFRNENGVARKKQLRPEQQTSFKWMRFQESSDSPSFDEQEIEEAIIPDLGWRASVRATKSCKVRGGVLADEVGYGKTATILGLIDDDKDEARLAAETGVDGSIHIKATLVVVPGTLVHQWKAEIKRFIGRRFKVLAISGILDLKATTIRQFKEAHVIIVSWTMFDTSSYLKRVALWAALPETSSVGGRPYSTWLSQANLRIEQLVEEFEDISCFKEIDDSVVADLASGFAAEKAASKVEEAEEDDSDEDMEQRDDDIIDTDEEMEQSDDETFDIDEEMEQMDDTVEEMSAGESEQEDGEGEDEDKDEEMDEDGDGNVAQYAEEDQDHGREQSLDSETDEDIEELDDEDLSEDPAGSLGPKSNRKMGAKSVKGQAKVNTGDKGKKTRKVSKKGHAKARRLFIERLKARLNIALNDEELLRAIPTQRLRGAKYAEDARRRRNGIKPVEFPPQVVNDGDYYDLDAASMDDVRGPCLQMFKFRRIVIDEWTYLKAKSYIYIRSLKCTFRWTLSGTPPLDDFAGIHRMAAHIHVNLGIVDDAPGTQTHESIRSLRDDRTEVETVLSYGQSYTTTWHQEKQQHAQAFLDHSVRQNQADVTLMGMTVEYRLIEQDSAEATYYRELQQDVESHGMKLVIQGRSRAERELQEQKKSHLRGNKSAAEALLKATSYFTMLLGDAEADGLTIDSCIALGYYRWQDMRRLLLYLGRHLRLALWLASKCEEKDAQYYWGWISAVQSGALEDGESTDLFLGYALDAQANCSEADEAIWYREKPDTATKKQETKWTEDRRAIVKYERHVATKARRALLNGKMKPVPIDAPARSANGTERAWGWAGGKVIELDVPPPPNTQELRLPQRTPFQIQSARETYGKRLRNLVAVLRSYGRELPTRLRSLRLLYHTHLIRTWIQELPDNPQEKQTCQFCNEDILSPDNMYVNTYCGHMVCYICPFVLEGLPCCPFDGCEAPAGPDRWQAAPELAAEDANRHAHGNKVQAIIELIQSIDKKEQVLLFVQFTDLLININLALRRAGIKTDLLATSGQNSVAVMKRFQSNTAENKSKVLLLNPSNETAAGINLVNANHVIFVHPLHLETKGRYDAAMKQCIGRALRYGQRKVVKVYFFLASNTFDIDLLQERTNKKIIRRTVEGISEWHLLAEAELEPEGEKEQEWGTGNKDKYYRD